MALINDAKKEIHAKIVYYGPGRSGKTTNLEFIYNKLKPEYRGKFKFMNTPSGRMVFFDFMRPELAAIRDFGIHFHIYTVPGESVDPSVWKSVLKGVDGVVFVADLDPCRTLENRRSLDSLKEYLQAYGTPLEEIPCIFQCNKRDAEGAVSVDEVRGLLDIGDVPVIPAAARSGEGVLPALSEMVKMVLQRLRDLPLAQEPAAVPADEETFPAVLAAEGETVAAPLEPIGLADDSDALTLEPVEEDADYGDEPEIEEIALEPETPHLTIEPAASVTAPEMSALDEMEPAEHEMSLLEGISPAASETASESSFQAAAWGFSRVSELSVPEETAAGYGEWKASGESGDMLPEIALEGEMESLGNGRFRLPLLVRCGDKEARSAICFDISLEKLN